MQKENITRAVLEAKRFLAKAKEYMDESSKSDGEYVNYLGKTVKSYPSCPAESGAVRRASLDLTRALAAMRRP